MLCGYTRYTLEKGQWCYRISATESFRLTSAGERMRNLKCVIKMTSYGEIFVQGQGNADRLVAILKRHGKPAKIEKGRATFGCREYYDDVGYDFVQVDSADEIRRRLLQND